MSFGAQKYVRTLRCAPDGSALSSAEKGILHAIAHDYRDELGFSFASTARLVEVTGRGPDEDAAPDVYERAMENGKRTVRRIVSGLVSKGLLRRHAAVRDRGAQTSNEYEFPEWAVVVDASRHLKARAEAFKFPRERRAPMQRKHAAEAVQIAMVVSSPGGPVCPPSPGPGCPPIESFVDSYLDLLPLSPYQNGVGVEEVRPGIAKARATASAKATATTNGQEAATPHAESEVVLSFPVGRADSAERRSGRARRWRRGAELDVLQLDGEAAAMAQEVARVMRDCGFTPGPLEVTIADALALRMASIRCCLGDAGQLAVERWKLYCTEAPCLRWTVMPRKFFREGIWLAPKTWPYDHRKADELSRARVGMHAQL